MGPSRLRLVFLHFFSGPSPSNPPLSSLFYFIIISPFPSPLTASFFAPLFILYYFRVALVLTFISSDADGQYNDVSIIYHIYQPSFPPRPIPSTYCLRSYDLSFPFQIARFSLNLSLCSSCVGFVSVRYRAFIYHADRIGLDWTGLDWTYPPPPTSTISYLLVVISPRAC